MGRSAANWGGDTAKAGGWIFKGACDASLLYSGSWSSNPALTRNTEGDFSFNGTASGAATIRVVACLSQLRRLIEVGPFFQEEFGGANAPVGVSGFPPYKGQTQFTPNNFPPNKGLQIDNLVVIYQPGVVSVTSVAVTLDEIVYANNVANVVNNYPLTNPIFPLTVPSTGPYVQVCPVTTPVMNVDDLSNFVAELDIVLANTGTIEIQGIGFHLHFNYN